MASKIKLLYLPHVYLTNIVRLEKSDTCNCSTARSLP